MKKEHKKKLHRKALEHQCFVWSEFVSVVDSIPPKSIIKLNPTTTPSGILVMAASVEENFSLTRGGSLLPGLRTLTLRSAHHHHELKFFSTCVSLKPLRSHIQSFGILERLESWYLCYLGAHVIKDELKKNGRQLQKKWKRRQPKFILKKKNGTQSLKKMEDDLKKWKTTSKKMEYNLYFSWWKVEDNIIFFNGRCPPKNAILTNSKTQHSQKN